MTARKIRLRQLNNRQKCALALFLLASVHCLAQPDQWTGDRLRSDDQSACFAALQAGAAVPAFICDLCQREIKSKLAPHDQGALIRELAQKNCEPKEIAFPEREFTGRSFYLDQDVLAFGSDLNDDRNYTMGMAYARSGARYGKGFFAAGRHWLDDLVGLHGGAGPLENIHSAEFGVTAFTPNELEVRQPIAGDRPYANLIYGANSKVTAYNRGYAVKSRLVLGAIGTGVAEVVQKFLHNDVGLSDQDPRGWGNQISDGGEPTALYALERVGLWREGAGRNWDISYTLAANIGYYTDVAAGVDVRIGRVQSPYYSHTANPLSVVNHARCYTCNTRDNFFFASYRARLVGYNVMLQGQFRDSDVTFSGSEIERLLHEASVGWTYRFRAGWQLTYALSYKSKEYDGPQERAHWFGGLYFSKNLQE